MCWLHFFNVGSFSLFSFLFFSSFFFPFFFFFFFFTEHVHVTGGENPVLEEKQYLHCRIILNNEEVFHLKWLSINTRTYLSVACKERLPMSHLRHNPIQKRLKGPTPKGK